jgi:carbamoyl-phosphate synthase large subunit
LFTSVGCRVELLRAFRCAYESLGWQSRIVAVDIDPLAPALQCADRPYLVPRLSSDAYVPRIVEICRTERVSLIFPLIDPDIPVLAANRSLIEATGARIAMVSTEAAEITVDKWQTTRFFQSLGLPTPRSWLPDGIPAAEID